MQSKNFSKPLLKRTELLGQRFVMPTLLKCIPDNANVNVYIALKPILIYSAIDLVFSVMELDTSQDVSQNKSLLYPRP